LAGAVASAVSPLLLLLKDRSLWSRLGYGALRTEKFVQSGNVTKNFTWFNQDELVKEAA